MRRVEAGAGGAGAVLRRGSCADLIRAHPPARGAARCAGL